MRCIIRDCVKLENNLICAASSAILAAPSAYVPLILDGLKRLEYRGYDSAGIAVLGENGKDLSRSAAPPVNCATWKNRFAVTPLDGIYGIGHTPAGPRMDAPPEENAHPHRDCSGEIVVVHNGIIENYIQLKKQLIAEGHKFITETDTEIIAHLVEKFFEDTLLWKKRYASRSR